jgi:hypothetical protein
MPALTPVEKERQRSARARSSRIRMGMVNYLQTLGDVIAARAENDHLTLGYKTWQEYLDTEYGAERLKLTPELQQKAIVELRLAGASQREIGYTLGLNQSNVSRALSDRPSDADASPDEIYDRDGNLVPPAKSPLVAAMTGAIEDADKRAKTAGAGLGGPAPAPNQPDAVDADLLAAAHGVPAEADGVVAPTAAGAGASDPAPAPDPVGVQPSAEAAGVGPSCEKCGSDLDSYAIGAGLLRCVACDPEGAHRSGPTGCALCADLDALIESVPAAYVHLQIAEGDDALYLRCGHCAAVVALLLPGTPLAVALIEANQHAENCP